MINVVPCERSHLKSMKGRTIEEVTANPADLSASVSIVKDGVVIGAGGLLYKEEGHYYVWSVLTPECVKNHKVTLHKIGMGFMEEVAPKLGIKQLTAFVLAGFKVGIAWAEVFGFEYEENVLSVLGVPYVQMRRLWDS